MASKLFPHTHQHNSMDCGPACLRMVAQAYGKHYRLETLRERCFISREGVSMLGLADAAETIGFRTMGVKTNVEELVRQRPLPCILHWNQNHFVVLYDIRALHSVSQTSLTAGWWLFQAAAAISSAGVCWARSTTM